MVKVCLVFKYWCFIPSLCVWICSGISLLVTLNYDADGTVPVTICGRHNSPVWLLLNNNALKVTLLSLKQVFRSGISRDGWLDTSFTIRHGSCSCCELRFHSSDPAE